MVHKIEISTRTIASIFLFLLGLYVTYILRDLIIGLFIAVLLTTALDPLVTLLEKFRVPRPLGIILVYILAIAVVAFMVITILPPLITQTNNLITALPIQSLADKLKPAEVNLQSLQLITNQLGSFAPVVKLVTSTFSAVVAIFTFLVITYYLLMERRHVHKHLTFFFGHDGAEKKAEKFVNALDKQLGGWVRGELALMLIVGAMTYLGLLLLGIPYALPLAILAGFLELIPNIGPTLSAIPSIVLALVATHNPLMAIFVIALYILVQQLEINFIVPKVMQSAVGIHPLATIILIIAGLKLMGIVGAVLAVPLFLVCKVIHQEYKPSLDDL